MDEYESLSHNRNVGERRCTHTCARWACQILLTVDLLTPWL